MIEIKNCSKAFGKIQAVNKVTMDIGEREVFGLIGSNGAGKSTLLRIMLIMFIEQPSIWLRWLYPRASWRMDHNDHSEIGKSVV